MVSVFHVKKFEGGWSLANLQDPSVQEEYCSLALDIPDEKIYETMMVGNSLEVVLTDLDESELQDDWYVNLNRVCA